MPETVSSRQPGGRQASSGGEECSSMWLTAIICHTSLRPEKPRPVLLTATNMTSVTTAFYKDKGEIVHG